MYVQRDFFIQFLIKNEMESKAEPFKDAQKVKTERLEMPWRDDDNKIDCAIFLMRHMETYFGNGLEDWDTQLIAGEIQQIRNMRVKYCSSIIEAYSNEKKNEARDLLARSTKKK